MTSRVATAALTPTLQTMVIVWGSLSSLVSMKLTITIAVVESSRSIVAMVSLARMFSSGAVASWVSSCPTVLFVVCRKVWSTSLTLQRNTVSLLNGVKSTLTFCLTCIFFRLLAHEGRMGGTMGRSSFRVIL